MYLSVIKMTRPRKDSRIILCRKIRFQESVAITYTDFILYTDICVIVNIIFMFLSYEQNWNLRAKLTQLFEFSVQK